MKMVIGCVAGLALVLSMGCGGECPPPPECPVCQQAPPPTPTPVPQQPVSTHEEWVPLQNVRVLFPNGGSELTAENQALLSEAVRTMQARNDIVRVRIEGHTDTVGRDANNSQLSLQRAQAVLEFLVAQGVPRGMLEAVGYGAERPIVVEGGHEQNRAQNRRVTFQMLVRR
ncbi:MAG: OmpA family protein [Myxococcota bacterium]